MKNQLKIPDDVKDEYGEDMDEEGEFEQSEGEEEKEAGDSDAENEVFAMARENKEMVQEIKPKQFANTEMVEKISKIEDEMMGGKDWQMKGEVQCKDRNYNSLLETYVDFDTATKLPP